MMNENLLTRNKQNYNHYVGQASRLSEDFWRRHLPHIQLTSGYYYFITFTTYNRKILNPFQKDCIFDAINFMDTKKYELHASVILNDHIHMIINPIDKLSKIMHSIKSYTAHEINKKTNRKGKFWQDENYDKIIRNEKEFIEKIKYIINNPIKANLSKNYTDYKWLYVRGWINNN
jgi:REP element-mobilizing transposase RayT